MCRIIADCDQTWGQGIHLGKTSLSTRASYYAAHYKWYNQCWIPVALSGSEKSGKTFQILKMGAHKIKTSAHYARAKYHSLN